MVKCAYCDAEAAFGCNYCDNYHCGEHRLPENHDCPYVAVVEQQAVGAETGRRAVTLTEDAERVDEPTRELPRCAQCGDVHLGHGDRCPDCREAATNRTAADGSLATQSQVAPDGGLPGERWRRARRLRYKLWAYRELWTVVAIVVALDVLGYVNLLSLLELGALLP